jgi:uncharacterized integral membrane protein
MSGSMPREPNPSGGPVTPGPGPTPANPEPEPQPQPQPQPVPEPVPAPSRLGGLWIILTSGAVVLIPLLVFILQNGQHVQIHLYGGHWDAPLGVALLMAAALGVLLVLVPGAGRIIQLRRTARTLHQDRKRLHDQLPQAPTTPPRQGDTGGTPEVGEQK